MFDDDALDARWREGLHTLAGHVGAAEVSGAADRVAVRVGARARRRVVRRSATSVLALAAIIATVVVLTTGRNEGARVHVIPGSSQSTSRTAATPNRSDPLQTLRITARQNLTLAASLARPVIARGGPLPVNYAKIQANGDVRLSKPGVYTFAIDGSAGHVIGFEGLPQAGRIRTNGDRAGTVTVDLRRGSYVIDCNIPGHARAGMRLHVIVG